MLVESKDDGLRLKGVSMLTVLLWYITRILQM